MRSKGSTISAMAEERESVSLRPPEGSIVDTRYWHLLDDGRVQCDVCPRACKLHDGQRGLCFVRGAEAGRIKLFSHGRSSGLDRKSTRLNSSHLGISYAVFCLKKKKK